MNPRKEYIAHGISETLAVNDNLKDYQRSTEAHSVISPFALDRLPGMTTSQGDAASPLIRRSELGISVMSKSHGDQNRAKPLGLDRTMVPA